jgi:hypothetical protein
MENTAVVKVLRTKPKWWTVEVTGMSSDGMIDEVIKSYQEVLGMGIRRVCLDLSRNNPEFTLVHKRTPDVLNVARKFDRVAALVSNAKTAFAIKASTKVPEEEFQVFYDPSQMSQWLEE